jgi:hypothetical protein
MAPDCNQKAVALFQYLDLERYSTLGGLREIMG